MNRWSLLLASLALCHGGGAALIAGHAGAYGPGGHGGHGHALPYGWAGCSPHFDGLFGPAPEVCPHHPGVPHYCAPPPVPVYGGLYRGTFPHDPIPFLWDFSYNPHYPSYYPPRSDYAISHHVTPVPVPVVPGGKPVAPPVPPGTTPEVLPGPGGADKPPDKPPAGPDGGL